MTPKEIRELFPLEIEISAEDRKLAHKLGEYLLRKYLPEELHEDIFWGLSIGIIDGVKIKTSRFETHESKRIEVPIYLDSSFKDNKIKFELR